MEKIDEQGEIFVRNNLTDFEKKLFLKQQVKELQLIIRQKNFEIGILKSDIDYLTEAKETRALLSLREENKNLRAKIRKVKDDYLVLLNKHTVLQQNL